MAITNYFATLVAAEAPQDRNGNRNSKAPNDGEGNESTMGGQSQKRKNSNQRIRNRPTHQLQHMQRKPKQQTIEGESVFNPEMDCVVCCAKKNKKPVPHRGHHNKCPKRLTNKAKVNPPHKQLMEYYESANKKPLSNGEKWNQLPPREQVEAFVRGQIQTTTTQPVANQKRDRLVGSLSFSRVKQSSNQDSITTGNDSNVSVPVTTILAQNNEARDDVEEIASECAGVENDKDDTTMDASTLRKVLDRKMLADDKKPRAEQQKQIPEPIIFMMQYIQSLFPEKFKRGSNEIPDTDRANNAMKWYQRHFKNGTATFTFPCDDKSTKPSPFYHSIEGMKVIFLNWELMVPGLELGCTNPECSGCLIRTRSDFSKRRTLLPIFEFGGDITWANIMNYSCNQCGRHVSGTDGRLLQSLPSHIRQEYPVDPRFASNQDFHLSRTFSDWLRELVVTDASGDKIAKSVAKKQGTQYERRLNSYFDQCHFANVTDALRYPSFHEWIGRFCPSGDHLRDLVDSSSRSSLTICGISDYERCTREIQSVSCETIMSQDHTVDIVKNYPRSLGAKTVWDVANENGEICSLVCVESTAARQYAHAAESLARRPNFRPKVMYSDIWPNGSGFWKLLFGDELVGRLGLFHFIKRIISTLRPSHPDYRRAITDLRHCIYRYDQTNEANVIVALENGTLGGQKHNDEQIQSLRDSPRWKAVCDPFLRKIIFTGDVIRLNLGEWFINYKVDASPGEPSGRGRLNPVNGQKLFTPDTKPAIEECKKTCKFLSDVLPPEQMYRSANASSKSKHGLKTQISNRGESRLECFHGLSADFANTSMRESLADALTIEGTAEANSEVRERIKFETLDMQEKKLVPAWLHGKPIFYNDSNKATLNDKAAAVGAPSPFLEVRPLPANNGELFLSEYLKAQQYRNENFRAHPENNRCTCPSCGNSKTPLPHQLASAPQNAIWNDYTKTFVSGSGVTAPVDDEITFTDILIDELLQDVNAIEAQDKPPTLASTKTHQLIIAPKVTLPAPQGESSLNLTTHAMLQPSVLPFCPPAHQQVQIMPIPGWAYMYAPAPIPIYPTLSQDTVICCKRKRKKLEVEYCCFRMQSWSVQSGRKGRMPHDDKCPQREKNRKSKRQRKKKN